MLYELLTGARPYQLEPTTPGALEDAILRADPFGPVTWPTRPASTHSSDTSAFDPQQLRRLAREVLAAIARIGNDGTRWTFGLWLHRGRRHAGNCALQRVRAVFRHVAQPGAVALQALVQDIAERVGRLLEKRGLIERDCENAWLSGDPMHAGLDIQPGQRAKLERLCRYVSRPPVAVERLALTATGQVRYALKTPYRDGTTHIVLEPLDLMARLAALVPPPRMHLTRYHGVFAPHSKLRAAMTPARRGKGGKNPEEGAGKSQHRAMSR